MGTIKGHKAMLNGFHIAEAMHVSCEKTYSQVGTYEHCIPI